MPNNAKTLFFNFFAKNEQKNTQKSLKNRKKSRFFESSQLFFRDFLQKSLYNLSVGRIRGLCSEVANIAGFGSCLFGITLAAYKAAMALKSCG